MIFTDQAHWPRKRIVYCEIAPPLYDVVPRVPGKWLFFGGRLAAKWVRLLINAVAELRLTLVMLAARLFESSLAGEMAEGLRHGKECS